ncbi:transferase family protein [Lasiodiplodia theobromae]|nr:transferase family protein [Lasiodiplodia theobromae]
MPFNGLKLHVRMFDAGDHRSHAELAERSFHPSEFDRWLLLPPHTFEESNEKPLCVAQVNCIPGGITLALGFNHAPTDVASIDLAISLICQCSKARPNGSSTPHSAFDYQRQPLAAPRENLISQVPDYHIMDA